MYEAWTEFQEYLKRLGAHIGLIYHQLQQLEARVDTLSRELNQVHSHVPLPRSEFTALARGILCPHLHAQWKATPKFLEDERWVPPRQPHGEFLVEITPRPNPYAQAILNKASALDCAWARHIILKPDSHCLQEPLNGTK